MVDPISNALSLVEHSIIAGIYSNSYIRIDCYYIQLYRVMNVKNICTLLYDRRNYILNLFHAKFITLKGV